MERKLIQEINLLENKKLVMNLNIVAIAIVLILTVLGIVFSGGFAITNGFMGIIWMFGGYAVAIVIHEAVHGIFFKAFRPEAKVKFGFKNGMAYAGSPGAFYTRAQFFIISIAPFIVLTGLFIFLRFLGVNEAVLYLIFALHTSGCVGDFYYCILLINQPAGIVVEDTDKGISFYSEG
ncbi:TPA: DUF3267 domain-containing protein [Listeria monocytogenes]|uniref:DUF3267 domain-containing protein n=1 Tax=Listeria monocytogenes TaxID=1639 RepID=A0A3T2I0H7_LISMN|nr:DUF3267 domain-containing protein [Listeria monocytogenes]EAE6153875.1 DUF3267 domain-containing protein [Listeria monocytogenes serotype 1/2a]EAF4518299.1 DUF3267 domain-containing protein [Listeria monocytogenes serotype 4b]EAG6361239.1 DUF3267 domain-containing protein [Listeria monocytogenes CFSAN002351]AEO02731.1 SPRL1 protein [Listeria monocytogenes J0161]AKG84787.1 transcriptional regulator [Listeria monocytogenes]